MLNTPGQIDLIATQILLDAQEAIRGLELFNRSTDDAGKKVEILKSIIERVAAQMGGDLAKAAEVVAVFANGLTGIKKGAVEVALALAQLNAQMLASGSNPKFVGFGNEQETDAVKESYNNFVKHIQIVADFQDKKDTWFEKDAANQNKIFEQTQAGYTAEEQAAAKLQKKKEDWWATDTANQNKSFEKTIADYKSLEQAVPRVATENFGNINSYIAQATNKVQAWKGVIQSVMAETGGSVEAVGAQLKKMVSGASIAPLNKAVKELGGNFENASRKSKYSIDVIRTALGVLTAMLVNVVLSAIVNFAKTSVKAFTDIEEALWRIHVAEKRLSEQGVDITFGGLMEGMERIKEELKIFSETDLLTSMSTFSAGMAKFGFTEEQIVQLTRYAAVLNVVSQADEDLQTSTDKLMTAMMSPQSRSVQSLNLQFGEQRMRLKGLKLGFLEAGEGAKELTLDEQAFVKQEIIKEEAIASLAEYTKYLETNSAKIKQNAAGWEDVKTSFGGFMTAIAPGLTGLFNFLTGAINVLKTFGAIWVATIDGIIYSIGSFSKKVWDGKNKLVALREVLTDFPTAWKIIFDFEIRSFFNGVPGDAPEWFKKLVGGTLDVPETPTNPTPPIPPLDPGDVEDEAKAFEKLQEELQKVAKDAVKAYDELRILTKQKYDKIELDLKLKLEDIDTEFAQKLEDLERELQQKLQDIAIETQQKIDDLKSQAREDEMRSELEFQQRMKELRQQFLMDLDDALHARDARQVLRLIKQYELDKKQALDKKKLDDKLRAEKLAADIKAAKLEEQRKIQEANREAARKEQELAIEKQREIDAANLKHQQESDAFKLWNEQEMKEIRRHSLEKLTELIDAYNATYDAHVEYQEKIAALIASYVATNEAAMAHMHAYMASLYTGISSMYAGAQSMIGGLNYVAPSNPSQSIYGGFAEGGSIIADKPTAAIFGERGRELVTFTPLDKTGRDVNKLFGDTSGIGTSGGRMLIEMLLSPDLEARVIENSLSRTAEIVARVSRSK